jgi:hypothetical protein
MIPTGIIGLIKKTYALKVVSQKFIYKNTLTLT